MAYNMQCAAMRWRIVDASLKQISKWFIWYSNPSLHISCSFHIRIHRIIKSRMRAKYDVNDSDIIRIRHRTHAINRLMVGKRIEACIRFSLFFLSFFFFFYPSSHFTRFFFIRLRPNETKILYHSQEKCLKNIFSEVEIQINPLCQRKQQKKKKLWSSQLILAAVFDK